MIEVNGAVDFGPEYSLGSNVFAAALGALAVYAFSGCEASVNSRNSAVSR